ncbi:hypothetical protein E4U42_000421, partial [Claviceps africana]
RSRHGVRGRRQDRAGPRLRGEDHGRGGAPPQHHPPCPCHLRRCEGFCCRGWDSRGAAAEEGRVSRHGAGAVPGQADV